MVRSIGLVLLPLYIFLASGYYKLPTYFQLRISFKKSKLWSFPVQIVFITYLINVLQCYSLTYVGICIMKKFLLLYIM